MQPAILCIRVQMQRSRSLTRGQAGSDGYHEISRSQAKAGDIWARRVPENGGTYSHTELIVGVYGTDHLVTIGSTNFASCASNAARGGSYQRVIYSDRSDSAQPGARYFTKQ